MNQQYKTHWDSVYELKTPEEVSWTQEVPETSLNFIRSFNLCKSANIIDVGGGDSKLVDHLLEEGFENITVLDISEKALQRSQKRLGSKGKKVNWIVSDINALEVSTKFDLWHDRATFHFLTSTAEIEKYISIAAKTVTKFMMIGTFSESGPAKCSGLPVKQYSEKSLAEELKKDFCKIRCITEDHITPFNTRQNFLFCSFKKTLVNRN